MKIMIPQCKKSHIPMKINTAHRKENGDIIVTPYCYREGNSKKGLQKRLTHEECKTQIIYKNGENFDLKRKISQNNRFSNLIGCWCNDNLKFETPVEAQNHRIEKHPEEFEE